jgi:hypothetical protein
VEEGGVSDALDWMLLAGKRAKGKRPAYFDDPADRPAAVDRDGAGRRGVGDARAAGYGRAASDAKGTIARATSSVRARCGGRPRTGAATREYIMRIMRGVQQDLEAMQSDDPPVAEVSKQLGET